MKKRKRNHSFPGEVISCCPSSSIHTRPPGLLHNDSNAAAGVSSFPSSSSSSSSSSSLSFLSLVPVSLIPAFASSSSSSTYLYFFDSCYTSQFRFISGSLPLSTLSSVLTSIAIYLFLVSALKWWIRVIRKGRPYQLTSFVIFYNIFLSLLSLLSLVFVVSAISSRLMNFSLWSVLCDEGMDHVSGSHVFIYYLIYLLKYFELCDTFLLCLRGKSTPFLHVYHHGITIFFAWLHLDAQTCIAWTMTILNMSVHVLLYAYFALQQANKRVWWKKYLSLMQVTQFYLTVLISLFVLIPRIIYTIDPQLPFAHACHGTWTASIVGSLLLLYYLYLFQTLYQQKYQTNKKQTKQTNRERQGQGETNGKGEREGEGEGETPQYEKRKKDLNGRKQTIGLQSSASEMRKRRDESGDENAGKKECEMEIEVEGERERENHK